MVLIKSRNLPTRVARFQCYLLHWVQVEGRVRSPVCLSAFWFMLASSGSLLRVASTCTAQDGFWDVSQWVQPSPTQQSRLACRQAGTNSAPTRSVSPCAHTLPHLLHGIRREAAAGLVKHACQACQHLGMPAAKAVGHIHLHARNLHRPTPKGCIAREGLIAKVAAGVPSPEG